MCVTAFFPHFFAYPRVPHKPVFGRFASTMLPKTCEFCLREVCVPVFDRLSRLMDFMKVISHPT